MRGSKKLLGHLQGYLCNTCLCLWTVAYIGKWQNCNFDNENVVKHRPPALDNMESDGTNPTRKLMPLMLQTFRGVLGHVAQVGGL